MAFSLSGSTITQTDNYLQFTVTSIGAATTTGVFTLTETIGATVQAGASTLDAVGRMIVNSTKLALNPDANEASKTSPVRLWGFVNAIPTSQPEPRA